MIRIMVICLSLFVNVAFAGEPVWEFWGSNSSVRWYTLKGSHSYDSPYASVWFLKDYDQPQVLQNGQKYQSAKSRHLFQCELNRSWVDTFIAFAGPMGNGAQVFTAENLSSIDGEKYAPDDWKSVGYDKFCRSAWQLWK